MNVGKPIAFHAYEGDGTEPCKSCAYRVDAAVHGMPPSKSVENTIRPNYYKREIALRNHNDERRVVECQDVIEGLGMTFNVGNAQKYLWRLGQKGGKHTKREDMKKVITYMNLELQRMDREGEE